MGPRLTSTESTGGALLQYESLRTQVLREEASFSMRGPGLALFIHHGMLAWVEMYHQCEPPADATLDKHPQTPALPHGTKSEMIKVMANIMVSNLKGINHGVLTTSRSEGDIKPPKKTGLLLYQAIHPEAGL
jgi:hypothetical protein